MNKFKKVKDKCINCQSKKFIFEIKDELRQLTFRRCHNCGKSWIVRKEKH